MKKNDVKIGQLYSVKVTGVLAEVRISGKNPHGGWDGTNLLTNRHVRIKSAQRLRGLVDRPAKRKTITTLTEHEAEVKAAATAGEVAPSAKKVGEATKDAKAMSLLDAAAHLLSLGTRDPMRCKDIVDLAVTRGLWKTGSGKTPASTLHAAMSREIAAKGSEARFRKTERGKFTLAK